MFTHLGGDTLILTKEILSIISIEEPIDLKVREYILQLIKLGKLKTTDYENYKSLVITEKQIYLSPISSLTLKKRADYVANL